MWSSIKQNWSVARDPSSGVPTDVTIRVEDEEIFEVKAHKYYLALVSPVFKTQFFGSFGGDKNTLVIEASIEVVKVLIDYIYLKEDLCWELKSLDEILEIARLADMYDVEGMTQAVKDAVNKIPITLQNVVETAHTAEKFSFINDISQFLINKCTEFLSQVLCSHVLDFSGLFSNSELASTAAKLHSLVLEVDPVDCSNCEHFPCLHGQLVPDEYWADLMGMSFPRGCLMTDGVGVHWTVVGYNFGNLFFRRTLLFVRETTVSSDGKPHLLTHDAPLTLGAGNPAGLRFECKKLGGAVDGEHLPEDDASGSSDY